MKDNHTNFGTALGGILAAAGSAVGLGNVWRFPTETGANGGAAFIIVYILFMILLGVPVMITELAIGRHGQTGVKHSFEKMSGGKKWWGLMGLMPFVAGIAVLSYYAVVAGWTLEYAFAAGTNQFSGMTGGDFATYFEEFSSDPWKPFIWLTLILLLTMGIVVLGVQKGIERGAKIMMPLLFLSITILVICSMTLPGVSDGLRFLFSPDFSKITGNVVLSAMGQAFFTLSVGICCLCTYGCYFRKDVDLIKNSFSVAAIDTLVAIMSGMIIFPAVYSIPGMSPNAGPALVFITLPDVFQQIFAGMPALAYGFSLTFYVLLVMAALTSSISMLEMSVAYLQETVKLNRWQSCLIVTCICIVLGGICSLSFGNWKEITVFGMGFFDLFDFLVAKLLMPIGAFLMCIFVGWIVDERVLRNELTNEGKIHQPFYVIYRFLVRYFAPACIIIIFIKELIS